MKLKDNEVIIGNKPLGVYAWQIIKKSHSYDYFIIYAIKKHLPEAEMLVRRLFYVGFEEIYSRNIKKIKKKNGELEVYVIRLDKIPALKALR